ncbi:uncharacterized protein LOC143427536 [Xylocopa sonorina]|uniref:uncharacterized protein LOC143427536 n=1 Tax=Xylocopa sonorina TaxID=1818115 RepID=UPI00403AAFF3
MSEAGTKESFVTEKQNVDSQSSDESNVTKNNEVNSLNESQDFRLVDTCEEECLDKLQEDAEDSNRNETLSPVTSGKETTLNEMRIGVFTKAAGSDAQTDDELINQENVENTESTVEEVEAESKKDNENNRLESKEKCPAEDEEVIQCTPTEVCSPFKKQSGDNAVTSLKRKADLLDEPPRKIARRASQDISVAEKEEPEREETSNHSFKSDDSQGELFDGCLNRNVIIEETQDVGEDEVTEVNKTIEKQTVQEGKRKDERQQSPELEVKNYEIDKNENVNDTSTLNVTVVKKGRTEEKLFDSNDVVVQSIQAKGKDATTPLKAVAVEKIKSDSSNKNTDNGLTIDKVKDGKIAINSDDKAEDKENGIESKRLVTTSLEQNNSNDIQELPVPKETSGADCNVFSGNACKSRMSVEVIYDEAAIREAKTKPRELVEIDEDGEKIVLDSSQEDSDVKSETRSAFDNTKSETIYKSCESKSSSDFSYKSIESSKETSLDSARSGSKLVNGSSESKRCDTDSTHSVQSDTFSDMPVLDRAVSNMSTSIHNMNRQIKSVSVSKDSDHNDLLSVSDNEPDAFIVDDKSKSNSTHSSSIAKALQVEREVSMYVKMKCLLHVDENTKEFLSKEITNVQCEAVAAESILRQKNNDTSASLADISSNDKDASPGSVNSNPQLYQLNPSRLSFASTISSLSSVSSAASLAAKLVIRDSAHFSLPRAPAKHAKRYAQDIQLLNDKQALDEAYERLTKEWQNSHLLTTSVLNYLNTELSSIDTYNVSNERIDEQLQKIRSSTPEVPREVVQVMQTPKSTKKSKLAKRPRSKSIKSEQFDQSLNGLNEVTKVLNLGETSNTPSRKKTKKEHVDSASHATDISAKPAAQLITDELIGKNVFAKWSDNNYYPGTVTDKIKSKYKVHFYDGENKVLIEDFIIPIPTVLKEGLSIYAATKNYDYGSCGIIVDTETVNNEVYYTVETDEGEKLRVQIKDISLSADQAQVLKEELNAENSSVPSTPKHLGQITLDNVVDGKRRSKRIATPSFSTPKSKLMHTPVRKSDGVEPSVSGVSSMTKKGKKALASESDGVSSDSNVSVKDELLSTGVQPEIIGTPYEQIVKGPQNRIKSKSRSKKKAEDEETIAVLGPIPRADSNLFKGMSFILTCASLETIDRFQQRIDSKDNGSDTGTENEEEWVRKPFVRDRLNNQIVTGGGKVYTDFNQIPQDEYRNTKLITNVPNTTAKTLQCLSVGIPVYNHNWIIRCCQQGKIVNPAENELPAGWSLEKNSYVEMFQRSSNKPLTQVVVIIPVVESEKQFASFWRQICENAGAIVLLADKQDAMEGFVAGTVVLTNSFCPSWAVEKANQLQIPLLNTTWIVQCLVEGKLCSYDKTPRYNYNYKSN